MNVEVAELVDALAERSLRSRIACLVPNNGQRECAAAAPDASVGRAGSTPALDTNSAGKETP